MKNLDLNAMGVVEMNAKEVSNIDAGRPSLPANYENWDNLKNSLDGLYLSDFMMNLYLKTIGRG